MGRTAFSAKLERLGHKTYEQYLRSAHWRRTRHAALEAQLWRCYACESRDQLHVHHVDYARLGAEAPDDLVVLCKSCHDRAHKLVKAGRTTLERAHLALKVELEPAPRAETRKQRRQRERMEKVRAELGPIQTKPKKSKKRHKPKGKGSMASLETAYFANRDKSGRM